jgi:creatinine amidohydrolase/Fe(II)-dependent formamide hydrolase-like protein
MASVKGIKKPQFQSPFDISLLTFPEIEKQIRKNPVLILPLGGCEPFTAFGALGIGTVVVQALAQELSLKTGILVAPPLPYGCSTPYASFSGTAGVKPRTLTNILCETIRMWHFQGMNTILVIDSLAHNGDAVTLAQKRCFCSHPGLTITVYSLEQCDDLRAFIAKETGGEELDRKEFALLSMAAWIDSGLVRPAPEKAFIASDAIRSRFRTWHKRGADPEQLRKFAPGCSCSNSAHRYDPDIGRSLFEYILESLEKIAAGVISPHHP